MARSVYGYLNPNVKRDSMLTVVHCGLKQNYPGEDCGPMSRDFYLLHYVISGKGIFKAKNNTYNLSSGDVFAIFPDEITFYKADEKDPWFFCWMGFAGTKADEYCKIIGMDCNNHVTHLNNNIFQNGVFGCIDYIKACNENNLSELRMTAFILEILSSFEIKTPKDKNPHIVKAISYMEYQYAKKITPADVAKYVNLEYSYFYKLFKSETGISPSEYLINLRVKKAKKLLQAGIEIKNIPMLTGINDVYYFSKLFKKYTGITPSEYKQKRL